MVSHCEQKITIYDDKMSRFRSERRPVSCMPLGDDRYYCPRCQRTFLHIGSGPGTGPVLRKVVTSETDDRSSAPR